MFSGVKTFYGILLVISIHKSLCVGFSYELHRIIHLLNVIFPFFTCVRMFRSNKRLFSATITHIYTAIVKCICLAHCIYDLMEYDKQKDLQIEMDLMVN